MNTFWSYLAVIALAALVTLPALVGHARDRAVDRQLRQAATRDRTPRTAPPPPHPAAPADTPRPARAARPEGTNAPCATGAPCTAAA
ncbi:hypothetical protein ACWDR0_03725 [Streptomyces sp. NPDC003691]